MFRLLVGLSLLWFQIPPDAMGRGSWRGYVPTPTRFTRDTDEIINAMDVLLGQLSSHTRHHRSSSECRLTRGYSSASRCEHGQPKQIGIAFGYRSNTYPCRSPSVLLVFARIAAPTSLRRSSFLAILLSCSLTRPRYGHKNRW